MKINSNLNENFNTPKKHPTFGVRKTDSIQSFINEIRTTNPNLGNIARLPIVQKMKESDTFEQLQEKANADKNMFENKRSFNIANKKGFTNLINSICIKIMQELETLGETVGKFIVQVEDENGNKKKNDIVSIFKNRLNVKAYHENENNSEKIKTYSKNYYKTHKDTIRETQRKYCETHKDEILEKKRKYRETHKKEILEKKRNYYETHKKEILEYKKKYRKKNSEKIKINFMLPETWQFEDLQSELKPKTSLQQEQTDYVYFMPQTSWQLEELQSELKPQTSLPQEQTDYDFFMPQNFQQEQKDFETMLQTSLPQEQTDYGFIPQIPWPQEQEDFELKPKTSWEQGQKDFETILPNFQQDPEDDFML